MMEHFKLCQAGSHRSTKLIIHAWQSTSTVHPNDKVQLRCFFSRLTIMDLTEPRYLVTQPGQVQTELLKCNEKGRGGGILGSN